MRYFIFPIENIYIAVSADKVKRFISHNSEESSDNGKIKITVNSIFGKLHNTDNKIFSHDIVLKQKTNDNKTLILVTPPVERDIDVAENQIQNLPGSFSGVYSSFNGLYFDKQNIIFFLNLEKTISLWFKKPEHEREGFL
ncbi:MAG: hypothetical protein FWB73_09395 [Treponema sp.]|nr:hypothetical protein [Treponema sp.]